MVLAAELGELAAKEVGGAFTNKHQHEHTGRDGKDLPATPAAQVTIFQLPDNGRGVAQERTSARRLTFASGRNPGLRVFFSVRPPISPYTAERPAAEKRSRNC